MNIRSKLTLYFTLFVAALLVAFSISIYLFYSNYINSKFNTRLENRALTTSRLFIQVKEIDSISLKLFDKNTINDLVDEKVVIFNTNNSPIYENLKSNKSYHFSTEEINKVRENEKVYYKQNKNNVVGILYKYKNEDYVVFASAFDRLGDQGLEKLKVFLIIGIIISIVVIFITGYFYSGRALSPILKVIKQVNNISAERLDLRLDVGNKKDEIATLSLTFNKMLERLELAFKMQRSFLSSTSHELRTPLTSITGQLEVALMKDRTINEYKEILHSLLDDTIRVNNLTNSLLYMAQSKVDSSNLKLKPVRIDEVLLQCQTEIYKRNPNYFIQINFDVLPEDDSKIITYADDDLIRIVFLNLIENACKFSENKTVIINIKFDNKFIIISFADTGIGIPQDDLESIFEPFRRGTNNQGTPGFGIGLSLVKRIIDLHKGKVEIDSEINKGTTITVFLTMKIN